MSATRRRGRHRRDGLTLASRGAAAVGLAGLLTALVLGAVPPQAAVAAEEAPDYTRTQTLTREHGALEGEATVVDSREVTVTVDHTQNLRGRERVTVSWSGAHPSGARASDPYGYGGMNQEYAVVIMQCRGLDDPSLPKSQQLSPETCWTTTYLQRLGAAAPSVAVWQHDRAATEADRADTEADTWPAECGEQLPPSLVAQHLVPFRAANGTVYQACNDSTIPPESSIDAALPAAETAAFTALDGTGTVQFEVRTDTENESLGCSADVPCSIVVIPIMGISCIDDDPECRKTGSFEAGSSNFGSRGVDAAVSPKYWWSESNWGNRFSVPLTFALPPDACDILDDRAPVDMYGSEVISQASLQWAPAYCLRADRFKFRHNRMSESVALRLLGTGEGVAAFVSEPAATSSSPLAYAPVAVSGFAVAYVSDLPDNAGELTTLRLTPRLLAKLLTQSYPASNTGRAHPGLEENPLTLNTDPEFLELNPTASQRVTEAMATILSLSESSDVIAAVTQYIAADAEAMAFVGGAADPWGMVVNPAYQGIELPRDEWPLLDTWVKLSHSSQECEQLIKTPYLTRVAAPVNSLYKVAAAVLDGWSNVQTLCMRSTTSDPWKIGRIARQPLGSRFMLGLVTLGDAARYGLHTAELRTSGTGAGATFVAPSLSSMATALETASQSAPGQPFLIDRTELPPGAYPGTMIVHTAARLSGLAAVDAGHVAQFVRTATTEGQVSGSANGQLPEGFLPILQSGPTAPLYDSAQVVADAIEAQTGSVVTATPTPTPTATQTTSRSPSSTTPDASPTQASGLPADEGEEPTVLVLGSTVTEHTAVGQGAVPVALGVGLAGLVAAPLLRVFATRRRLS